MKNKTRNAASIVVSLIMVIAIPVTLTLRTVVEPVELILKSDNPTPLGYTISLSLFVFPMLAIAWWFLRHKQIDFQKKAFIGV